MKKKLLSTLICMIFSLFLLSCGNHTSEQSTATTAEVTETNIMEDTVPLEEGLSEDATAEETTPKPVYDFTIDNSNRLIERIKLINNTDLFLVTVPGNLDPKYVVDSNKKYVMDANGNTLFLELDETVVTDDHKYIYTYNFEGITIYNAITHENITPPGINEYFNSSMFFIEKDVLVTKTAAFDLNTGKCIWYTDSDVYNMSKTLHKANELMLYRNYDDQIHVFNYMTGTCLTDKLTEEYDYLQINSSGFFCTQSGNTVKVYDKNGNLTSEFTLPDGYQCAPYLFPGEHFGFYFSSHDSELIKITDLTGNIIMEEISIGDGVYKSYDYYSPKDIIYISGNDYSGLLDSSMNWIISQDEKIYDNCYWLYGDIYCVSNDNYTYTYIYNSSTKALLEGDTLSVSKSYFEGSEIIGLENKIYDINSFQLLDFEFSDYHTYHILSETTFAEYVPDESEPITIYQMDGSIVTTLPLDYDSEFVTGIRNTIITYDYENGYRLLTF